LSGLIEIFIIDGDNNKEAEFYFHFGESHHPSEAILTELFVLAPLTLQINRYSFQKLLVVSHKIFPLDVKAPSILHIFIGLHSKWLDGGGRTEVHDFSLADTVLGGLMLRDYLEA
jgi:hypothetical protein